MCTKVIVIASGQEKCQRVEHFNFNAVFHFAIFRIQFKELMEWYIVLKSCSLYKAA